MSHRIYTPGFIGCLETLILETELETELAPIFPTFLVPITETAT